MILNEHIAVLHQCLSTHKAILNRLGLTSHQLGIPENLIAMAMSTCTNGQRQTTQAFSASQRHTMVNKQYKTKQQYTMNRVSVMNKIVDILQKVVQHVPASFYQYQRFIFSTFHSSKLITGFYRSLIKASGNAWDLPHRLFILCKLPIPFSQCMSHKKINTCTVNE